MKTVDLQKKESYRKEILQYAAQQYGTIPECPWMKYPEYVVLRHTGNKKWYALIMNVPRNKLGLSGKEYVDILNIKCDPVWELSLLSENGILPAYHMQKSGWVSVLLDGTVDKKTIFSLLTMSFDLTGPHKPKQKRLRPGTTEWIVPANPKYFDLEKAFSESEIILWKQSSSIAVGDIVYLYVASPVSAIRYKCKTTEVNIPYQYDDENISMQRVMKIQLLHRFDPAQLRLETLKEYGITTVRGPRSVPNSLHYKIKELCGE